jgi:thiamine pyrophosphate-dependent acetolactate synthase large subunit-like protein
VTTTAAAQRGRALRSAGIDAVYGSPLEGFPVIEVPGALAPLLAAAHERVHVAPAAVHRDDGELVVASSIGEESAITSRWEETGAETIATIRAARRAVVVAGSGVVADHAVPGLHAFAAATGVGVLNSWTAKGVFDWRSRHHFATVGLQARDLELGGLVDVDLVITTGLRPGDGIGDVSAFAPVVDIPTAALAPLAAHTSRVVEDLEYPPLRQLLTPVSQQGWESTSVPLPPTKVTLDYSRALGATGVVAADPGVSGYWVARTFTTVELGSALVASAADTTGFAVACAIVERLRRPARPVLAVVDAPITDTVGELLELASSLGVGVGVEVWDNDGDALDAGAHVERVRALSLSERVRVTTIATDPGQLAQMTTIAGPIVAWP